MKGAEQMNRTPGKIPVIRPLPLPTVDEMAAELSERETALFNTGTDAQRAARLVVSYDAARMREELRRGRQAVDLQDIEQVKARSVEFLAACEKAGRVPLWTGLVSRGFGLSRQYVHKWLNKHEGHETAEFLMALREALADSLASAAISGSVSAIPSIFALKAVFGWKDAGEDDLHDVGADGDEASYDLRQIMARYGGQEAAEGASGALDDASDV